MAAKRPDSPVRRLATHTCECGYNVLSCNSYSQAGWPFLSFIPGAPRGPKAGDRYRLSLSLFLLALSASDDNVGRVAADAASGSWLLIVAAPSSPAKTRQNAYMHIRNTRRHSGRQKWCQHMIPGFPETAGH